MKPIFENEWTNLFSSIGFLWTKQERDQFLVVHFLLSVLWLSTGTLGFVGTFDTTLMFYVLNRSNRSIGGGGGGGGGEKPKALYSALERPTRRTHPLALCDPTWQRISLSLSLSRSSYKWFWSFKDKIQIQVILYSTFNFKWFQSGQWQKKFWAMLELWVNNLLNNYMKT